MSGSTADVVICGAGIAGISTAYHLTVRHGVKNVLLVDERPPLSLTSDKSTECYRNWWPGPGSAMVELMNRSIDLLEGWAHQSNNGFHLNRRGYLFATARPTQAETYRQLGQEISDLGAGPLRIHNGTNSSLSYQPAAASGYRDQPDGADLILDQDLILEHFPYLSEKTIAVMHARRCGWLSAQQLGQWLLTEAQSAGVELLRGRVEGIHAEGGSIKAIDLAGAAGPQTVETGSFVVAAGPMAAQVAGMLDVQVPIFCELHSKIAIPDSLGAVPREAPLLIWSDPQQLPWKPEERQALATDSSTAWLAETFPAGVHARPEGSADSPISLLLWTYDTEPIDPVFPPPHDEIIYPEVTIRGLSTMLPAMKGYFEHLPRPVVDGGYYAKTEENRPLVCPLPVDGAYLIGALSGFGVMASPAAGELLAAHLVGDELPNYEGWFRLERYGDPGYQRLLEDWGSTGQL
ncbi:MAG: FAD-dependent oxidoreductase [Anaerolineales bacterium]